MGIRRDMKNKLDWNNFTGTTKIKVDLKELIPENVKLYPRADMTEIERLEWYIEELKKDLAKMKKS